MLEVLIKLIFVFFIKASAIYLMHQLFSKIIKFIILILCMEVKTKKKL